MKRLPGALALFLLALFAGPIGAAPGEPGSRAGSDTPFATGDDILPVEEAYELVPRMEEGRLVLEWHLEPGYYLYRDRFSSELVTDSGETRPLEQSFEAGVERYDDYFGKEMEVYYDRTSVRVTLPDETEGLVRVKSQGCADAGLCYPPRIQYVKVRDAGAEVVEGPANAPASRADADGAGAEGSSLSVILVFALAGGLILNLMPCVFPVLSIKVLSLTQSHLTNRGRHLHGIAYTLGVTGAFLVIAALLIALRAGGEALGWGFQLQSPLFVIFLIYLFFLMGLAFSGFFAAGTRLMNLGQEASAGSGLRHSFLTGILATLVASPCSAPFMGTALGFALTQPSAVALLVFAALGLGMALPFLVLTWAPGLLARLPRPGPWMDSLKQFLAFPLYLTSVWLIWLLGRQTGPDLPAAVLAGLVLVALAIWLGSGGRFARVTAAVTLIAALALPALQYRTAGEEPLWEPYSPQRLETLLDRDRGVFINLTADWCLTCLANERVALSSDRFAETLESRNIVYLKGDWTDRDPEITELLNAHGRSGVPLYLFYPPGERQPRILPQILTPGIVERALRSES